MFDAEENSLRTRRSGICIQRNQESRHRRKVLESKSDDELSTSGGREGGGEEEEDEGDEGAVTDGYPRGRRNAIRGARVHRRATCAADGTYGITAATARRNAADRPG